MKEDVKNIYNDANKVVDYFTEELNNLFVNQSKMGEVLKKYKCDNIPLGFVSGPFRGKDAWEIEQNIRRAEELAFAIWKTGAAAICPHSLTRFWDRALPDEVFLTGDLAILASCDFIIHTVDWERSEGARKEHEMAEELGLEIFYDIEQVKEFMKQVKENVSDE